MIAHLQLGRFEDARILSESTARMMHAPHFSHHPSQPGMAYGFSENLQNGRRVLRHSGLILGFSSLLVLIPEEDAGIFISASRDGGSLCSAVVNRFMNHYFHHEPSAVLAQALDGYQERVKKVCGAYRNNRYCRTTFFKAGTMIPPFVQEMHIAKGRQAGVIEMSINWSGGKPVELVETEPYCFASVARNGDKLVLTDRYRFFFRTDSSGYCTEMLSSHSGFERLPWYQTQTVLAVAASSCVFIFLLTVILSALRRLRRRARRAHPLLWLTSAMNLAFVIGLAILVLTVDIESFGYGPPPFLVMILLFPLVSLVLTLVLVFATLRIWLKRLDTLATGISYTLVSISSVLFLLLLHYWNLLGFCFA